MFARHVTLIIRKVLNGIPYNVIWSKLIAAYYIIRQGGPNFSQGVKILRRFKELNMLTFKGRGPYTTGQTATCPT